MTAKLAPMWQLYIMNALAGAFVGVSGTWIFRYDLPVVGHRTSFVLHLFTFALNIWTLVAMLCIIRMRLRMRSAELRRALQDLEPNRPDALD